MLIKGRPLGVCILAGWTVAHVVPGSAIALSVSGLKSALASILVVVQLTLAAGLIMRWRAAWYLVVAEIGANVFIFSVVAWAFVFVAAAWELHATDAPVVVAAGVYLLGLCVAFLYLFHPEVRAYFTRPLGLPSLADLRRGFASVGHREPSNP